MNNWIIQKNLDGQSYLRCSINLDQITSIWTLDKEKETAFFVGWIDDWGEYQEIRVPPDYGIGIRQYMKDKKLLLRFLK